MFVVINEEVKQLTDGVIKQFFVVSDQRSPLTRVWLPGGATGKSL